MDWQLAFNIVIGLGLILVGAWSFDARRLAHKACRLLVYREQPTEEIELPAWTGAGGPEDFTSARSATLNFEDFGPGKPVPKVKYRNSW
jgi:hypothetical protein